MFFHWKLVKNQINGIAAQISWQKTDWNESFRSKKKKMQVDHQKGKKVLLTVLTDVVDSTPEETLRDEKEKIT